jgi:hypothetical protein
MLRVSIPGKGAVALCFRAQDKFQRRELIEPQHSCPQSGWKQSGQVDRLAQMR